MVHKVENLMIFTSVEQKDLWLKFGNKNVM